MRLLKKRDKKYMESKSQLRLSIIVIVYDMQREGLRTLQSLSPEYQENVIDIDYEVILVDNNSPVPFSESDVERIGPNFRYCYYKSGTHSPASAINYGVQQSKGDIVGVMIDGARMVTPGVIYWAAKAFDLYDSPLACVLGFHLGPEHQAESIKRGYSKKIEDELLDRISWRDNGYRLFELASWAGSCQEGWFGNIAESNCIFISRNQYDSIGGFDEAFESPGGGVVNLDFYKRACALPGVVVVYLQGEGCFHQLHGGVTTGGNTSDLVVDIWKEYQHIRGEEYSVPQIDFSVLGHVPLTCINLIDTACRYILEDSYVYSMSSSEDILNWSAKIK